MNDLKESLCYVAAQGTEAEMDRAVGSLVPAASSAYREWVLPTYHGTDDRGHVRNLAVDEVTQRFRRTRKGDESKGQVNGRGVIALLEFNPHRLSENPSFHPNTPHILSPISFPISAFSFLI